MHYSDFVADTLPVEEMLVFLCGEMKEYPVVSLYAIDEDIGECVAPKPVYWRVFG